MGMQAIYPMLMSLRKGKSETDRKRVIRDWERSSSFLLPLFVHRDLLREKVFLHVVSSNSVYTRHLTSMGNCSFHRRTNFRRHSLSLSLFLHTVYIRHDVSIYRRITLGHYSDGKRSKKKVPFSYHRAFVIEWIPVTLCHTPRLLFPNCQKWGSIGKSHPLEWETRERKKEKCSFPRNCLFFLLSWPNCTQTDRQWRTRVWS